MSSKKTWDDHSTQTLVVRGETEEQTSEQKEDEWSLSSYDLGELLGKWALFYEAQESGVLSVENRVPWRGHCYLADGLFAAGRWNPDFDLTGGWHDAGDHLKLMFPFCWSVVQMGWGMVDGRATLKATGFDDHSNWDWAMATLTRGMDYIQQCLIAVDAFVCQVGETDADHSKALRCETDNETPRTLFIVTPEKPGADMFAIAAAALAAGALALDGAEECCDVCERQREALRTALAMYHVASTTMKGTRYAESIPEAAKTYNAETPSQYMFLAAVWLFRASQQRKYLDEAIVWMKEAEEKRWWPDYSWHSSYFGAVVQLLHGEQYLDNKQMAGIREQLDWYCDGHLEVKNGVRRTPQGLTYMNDWGSLRHAQGTAAIMASYARDLLPRDPKRAAKVASFAEDQVCFALGASGRSFVIGFGKDFPVNPHHRDSALKLKDSGNWEVFQRPSSEYTNPNVLVGALVGGPGIDGSYEDDRNDYQKNEVALDYNAALFVGVLCTKRALDEDKGAHVRVTVRSQLSKPSTQAAAVSKPAAQAVVSAATAAEGSAADGANAKPTVAQRAAAKPALA